MKRADFPLGRRAKFQRGFRYRGFAASGSVRSGLSQVDDRLELSEQADRAVEPAWSAGQAKRGLERADHTRPYERRIAVKLFAKLKGRIIRLGLRLHDALFPPDWGCLCSPCSRSHACGGAIHNEHAFSG